jgi:hypothetical protein
LGSLCSSILQACPSHLNHKVLITVAISVFIKICKLFIWSHSSYSTVVYCSKYYYSDEMTVNKFESWIY